MRCEYCDRINTPDANQCAYCGAPLEKTTKKQTFQNFIDTSPLEAFVLLIGAITIFSVSLGIILISFT